MARFSASFTSNLSQAELDFVDIDTSIDNRLYLDPYAIQIRSDEWSSGCGDLIRSFFNEVLDMLRQNRVVRAEHLMDHLHEPNETFFGQSKGFPDGRGVGKHKASGFAVALKNSKALKTGVLSDISEAELFIHGIGPDTISDLTTNIVRGKLADYTKDQCELHRIATSTVASLGPQWSIEKRDWQSRYYELPVINGHPIFLVPKFSVRRHLSLNSQEFYNFHMVNFLQAEYLDSRSSLVQTFKDGTLYVTKTKVRDKHPFVKDDLAAFVRDHPEVLETYKELKGARGPLEPDDLEEGFDEKHFANALIKKLAKVPSGNAKASHYHSLCIGICTFLFHPQLTCPVKEKEIHQGRKRIDIKFNNSGEPGFFNHLLQSAQARASSVMIECKNYTKDIANPEMDQLSARFGHQRGFFGIMLCRSIDCKDRIAASCKDAASDGRGYMLILDDEDITLMLSYIAEGHRSTIDYFLKSRYDVLTD